MVRESIKIFSEAMEKKLQRDDATKGPWEGNDIGNGYLFGRLLDEVSELGDADSVDGKMQECCDIANFSMMIFSRLHPGTKNLKRGRMVEGEPGGVGSSECTIDRNALPANYMINANRDLQTCDLPPEIGMVEVNDGNEDHGYIPCDPLPFLHGDRGGMPLDGVMIRDLYKR